MAAAGNPYEARQARTGRIFGKERLRRKAKSAGDGPAEPNDEAPAPSGTSAGPQGARSRHIAKKWSSFVVLATADAAAPAPARDGADYMRVQLVLVHANDEAAAAPAPASDADADADAAAGADADAARGTDRRAPTMIRLRGATRRAPGAARDAARGAAAASPDEYEYEHDGNDGGGSSPGAADSSPPRARRAPLWGEALCVLLLPGGTDLVAVRALLRAHYCAPANFAFASALKPNAESEWARIAGHEEQATMLADCCAAQCGAAPRDAPRANLALWCGGDLRAETFSTASAHELAQLAPAEQQDHKSVGSAGEVSSKGSRRTLLPMATIPSLYEEIEHRNRAQHRAPPRRH
ncbi:hypothetical protein M885DRAFT_545259 [Pelagophyceae sp. CCMP2097]|nr:hypothetical protein M885DRAFT_545259 [Pelagophyceae sp. CCMP2097]